MNPKTAAVRNLLFDWDGTLVDSAQLGLAAFQQSFAKLGVAFDHDVYCKVYSPNWYSVYEAMGLPKEKWDLADELWIQHYGEHTPQLVEGAKTAIVELHDDGYRLGIVSSGGDCRVRREVTQLGMEGLFDVIVCNEQMENKKPHPEGLETAMRALGCSPAKTCYVGDSPQDIEMGKRAGMLTVGVRSNYPTSWQLQSFEPDIYVESIGEVSDHFSKR
jgi:phosphoglycolate phosphatase